MDSTNPDKDSTNPYSQFHSYVVLLNSQRENVSLKPPHQNFPYESFPSSANIGAEDNPPFNSQESEAPPIPEATPAERRERKKWTPADDEVLISAWLNTSKDAIVGNEQKSCDFWKRVGGYYAASPHAIEGGDASSHSHCKQRWSKINDQTNKFCGAYAAAERQMTSGQNENDVLKMAHDIYYSDHNTKFTLEHAWCILRFEQKWLSLNTHKSTATGKRKTTDEAVLPASTINVTDHEVRPKGIKAAKATRNHGKGKAFEEYKSMWELKMGDLAMKERLSKLAILDTLLSKKEPLSEGEKVVKNKLLAEYF